MAFKRVIVDDDTNFVVSWQFLLRREGHAVPVAKLRQVAA